MITLLSWLWNRATRVYEIIGTLYTKVRNAALKALSWAIIEAGKALQRAKAWALSLVTAAKVVIKLTIEAVVTWINARLNDLVRWVLDQSKKLEIFLSSIFDAAVDWLKARLADLDAAILRVKATIEATVKGWINAAINTLIKILLPLILLKDKIKDLIATFDGGLLDALIDFFQRMYTFLSEFVQRPLGMILGMLQGVILPFLSWVIGYALGTEKYTLPPWPSWDEMEIPGPSGPNPRPPKGTGKLGNPLSSLYVSGHRYRDGHRGTDFGLTTGQAVFASHDARVEFAGWSTVGYGNTITLRSGTWWTRYAHLSQISIKVGDRIDRGQTIGLGGSTGNSSGPHLHFEVKHQGKFVDPLTVLSL